MMLDHYEHTLDETLLRETLLPFAQEILTFYDLHYPADESGKIVMEPSQALETWWDCRNPMPEIAGILAEGLGRGFQAPRSLQDDRLGAGGAGEGGQARRSAFFPPQRYYHCDRIGMFAF